MEVIDMFEAINADDVALLQHALDRGDDMEVTNSVGNTPL